MSDFFCNFAVSKYAIYREKADSRYMSEDALRKATGTTDKELFLIPAASHIKTYYVPEYVEQERAKVVQFFNDKL